MTSKAQQPTSQAPVSKQSLRVWLRLLKASAAIETTLKRRLRETHQTTLPRFDVMSALARFPEGMKMSEISGVLRVSNGNVTGIVDRLVEDGLVRRAVAPNDRRALTVQLTAAGQAVFDQQAADHEAWVTELLAGLGGENLLEFGAMLERLNQHLDSDGENHHD